jgi:predicted anti-sigma-YlaC factor YlaD
MNRHLDDQEIAAAVAGLELEAAQREHLGSCLSCRAAVMEMAELISSRKQQMLESAPDWRAQEAEILARLATTGMPRPIPRRRWLHPVMAMAATVLLAVGIVVFMPPTETVDSVTAGGVPVEQVLAEVDALLADDSIPGLWPVDPMADSDDLEDLFSSPSS